MPSCPQCGLDVEAEGLCKECKTVEPESTAKSTKNPSSINPFYLVIIAIICLLAGITGIFIGKSIAATPVVNDTASSAETQKEAVQEPETKEVSYKLAYDVSKRDKHPPTDNREDYVNWMVKNTNEDEYYINWRWDCIQDLLKWRSLRTDRVIEAFLLTPRENFIRERNLKRAYDHAYMAIGYGATITDPWVVSTMTEAINPGFDHKVLEIGTGSGYQSALLSQISNYVYSIEIINVLAKETDELCKSLEKDYPEYKNIKRKRGDGYFGWEEYAPFDRIIVTCAIDHIPPALLKQLVPGGIMVIPVGPPSGQRLLKITKHEEDGSVWFDREDIFKKQVHFIPFTKKGGGSYSIEEEK